MEARAAAAHERVAALETLQPVRTGMMDPAAKAKLATEGILASTLAASARDEDDASKKSAVTKEEAKILGTAAAIGGAAGLLAAGPLGAVVAGGMAAYATTRDDT